VVRPHGFKGHRHPRLDKHLGLSLGSARVLIVGLAYKKDVSDIRESPSLKLIELLEDRGTTVDFHEPYGPQIPLTREHANLAAERRSGSMPSLSPDTMPWWSATDHSALDYALLSTGARLIVDTRNAIASRGLPLANVVKA
jgi:UDP-N-acetyl-D-glucosamine dehydrogenase